MYKNIPRQVACLLSITLLTTKFDLTYFRYNSANSMIPLPILQCCPMSSYQACTVLYLLLYFPISSFRNKKCPLGKNRYFFLTIDKPHQSHEWKTGRVVFILLKKKVLSIKYSRAYFLPILKKAFWDGDQTRQRACKKRCANE